MPRAHSAVRQSLAEDWWSLIKLEWIDTGQF